MFSANRQSLQSGLDKIFKRTIQQDLKISSLSDIKESHNTLLRINSKECVKNFGPEWVDSASQVIHVGNYQDAIATIKIQRVSDKIKINKLIPNHLNKLITLKYKDEKIPRQYFLMSDKDPLKKLIEFILKKHR